MTTPRDQLERLRAMLTSDGFVEMRDNPAGFAAGLPDPEIAVARTEGLQMRATAGAELSQAKMRIV